MSRIFLGNGKHSQRAVQELHDLLDEAIEILGGLQQPMTCVEKFEPSLEKKLQAAGEKRIREIVKYITDKLL